MLTRLLLERVGLLLDMEQFLVGKMKEGVGSGQQSSAVSVCVSLAALSQSSPVGQAESALCRLKTSFRVFSRTFLGRPWFRRLLFERSFGVEIVSA